MLPSVFAFILLSKAETGIAQAAAILMHGKEPGLRELWRWMRAGG